MILEFEVDSKIRGGVCDNRNRDLIVLQPIAGYNY